MKKTLAWFLTAAAVVTLSGAAMAASALFCAGGTDLNASDAAAKARLEKLGFTVTVADDDEAASANPSKYDLVLVSSTVTSGNIVGVEEFLTTATPTLLWEQGTFDEYQLSTVNAYDAVEGGAMSIEAAKHPIAVASGLKGQVRVYADDVEMHRGTTEVGTAVANVVGTDHIGVFALDKGADLLDGSKSPNRRAWFAASDNSFASMTDDGWKLFDATIKWLAAK